MFVPVSMIAATFMFKLNFQLDVIADLVRYLDNHIVESFAEEYDNSEPHYHRLMTLQYT